MVTTAFVAKKASGFKTKHASSAGELRPPVGLRLPPAGRRRLRERHADAAQGGVDEQRIAGNTVGDPARVLVEQIRGDDFVVVPGRVREGAPAVRVAQRPDALGASAALVVDREQQRARDNELLLRSMHAASETRQKGRLAGFVNRKFPDPKKK